MTMSAVPVTIEAPKSVTIRRIIRRQHRNPAGCGSEKRELRSAAPGGQGGLDGAPHLVILTLMLSASPPSGRTDRDARHLLSAARSKNPR
jgi:hypothetical protein